MAIHSDLFEKRYIDRDSVLLDSACFNHIFNDKKWFIEFEGTTISSVPISDSNGGVALTQGKGTIRVPFLRPDNSIYTLDLPNTLYQPSTPCNLVSAGQLELNSVIQDGFGKTICYQRSGEIIAQYTTIDNVFVLRVNQNTNRVFITTKSIDYRTLYRRLLYCGHKRVLLVAKEMGIVFQESEYKNFNYDVCYKAKEKQQISRTPIAPA